MIRLLPDAAGSPLSEDEKRLLQRVQSVADTRAGKMAEAALTMPDAQFVEFFTEMSDQHAAEFRVAMVEALMLADGYSRDANANLGAKLVKAFREYYRAIPFI